MNDEKESFREIILELRVGVGVGEEDIESFEVIELRVTGGDSFEKSSRTDKLTSKFCWWEKASAMMLGCRGLYKILTGNSRRSPTQLAFRPVESQEKDQDIVQETETKRRCQKREFIRVWNVERAFDRPKGTARFSKCPKEVTNAFFGISDSSIRIC